MMTRRTAWTELYERARDLHAGDSVLRLLRHLEVLEHTEPKEQEAYAWAEMLVMLYERAQIGLLYEFTNGGDPMNPLHRTMTR